MLEHVFPELKAKMSLPLQHWLLFFFPICLKSPNVMEMQYKSADAITEFLPLCVDLQDTSGSRAKDRPAAPSPVHISTATPASAHGKLLSPVHRCIPPSSSGLQRTPFLMMVLSMFYNFLVNSLNLISWILLFFLQYILILTPLHLLPYFLL